MNANEIIVDEQGNCTVIGAIAHQLWKAGGFPKSRCSPNNFYVYEFNELPQGYRWEVVGWSAHFIDVQPGQVLVNVRKAPMIGGCESDFSESERAIGSFAENLTPPVRVHAVDAEGAGQPTNKSTHYTI